MVKLCALLAILAINGCTTSFIEAAGECVSEQWTFGGMVIKRHLRCDLPPPDDAETPVREIEMDSFEEVLSDTP